MEILEFIFILGINFSIFGFIWGLIMLGVRLLQPQGQPRNQSLDYVLRIIKYFMLVSVTANFIVTVKGNTATQGLSTVHIVVGTIVLALYLLGKLQNRAILQQLGQNPLFSGFANSVDPKVERYLLLGSVAYFVACLLYPGMVDNGLVNWFTASILNIADTPIIGWVFKIIAFFFLINILMRAANVIGRLLNGQPLTSPGMKSGNPQQRNPFNNNESSGNNGNGGFSDYEDVTEEEDKK